MRYAAIILVSLSLVSCGSEPPSVSNQSPNVLLIFVDDLNTDLENYGHATAKTPNITRLAKQGVTFHRAYAQYPQCNQSRASILTGRYPAEIGVMTLQDEFRINHPDIVTLPEHFKHHGYVTARVGKIFHQGVPGEIGQDGLDDAQSWDRALNPAGIDNTLDGQVQTITPDGKDRPGFGGVLSWLSVPGDGSNLTDHKVADAAIQMLEKFAAAGDEQPFFLAVGFYRPHTPYIVPEQYFSDHPIDTITVPEVRDDERGNKPVAALADRPDQLAMTDGQKRSTIRAYRAAVSFVDTQVGRLMQAVEDEGLLESTIVVFLSDHGYQLGQHGLWQKGDLFERSAHTPLIMLAPGALPPNVVSHSITELVDVYPTIVSLAGIVKPEQELSGKDLTPIILEDNDGDNFAFTQASSRAAWTRPELVGRPVMGLSVRSERYRYTEWDEGEMGAELYDYHEDPEERINLYNSMEYGDVVVSLKLKLAEFRRQLWPQKS